MSLAPALPTVRINNRAGLPAFPQTLNPDERDPFTQLTYRELFDEAVRKIVPVYVIAIAQLPPQSPQNKPHYKAYDGIALRNYMEDCAKQRIPCLDPQTRDPLTTDTKISYFSVRCFGIQNGEVVPVAIERQVFQPLQPSIRGQMKRLEALVKVKRANLRKSELDERSYHEAGWQHIKKTILGNHGRVAKDSIRSAITRIQQFSMDGANFHSPDAVAVGKSQFIVAGAWRKLLHPEEEKIWKWCASKHIKIPTR